ncbi:MAG: esterase family protein [Dysgonamonadaceae bacterium]|jgi:S-formylglutathione hydrolase FrmB|nr:esterase family protein [Dysgonamonadaceae bacterium]
MKKIGFLLIISLLFPLKKTAANVDSIRIFSPANGISIRTLVILPEKALGEQAEACPVVYLLHGYSGNETDWLTHKTDLPSIADEKGLIIVCPDGKNSWYLDSPLKKDNQYETFISVELINYIDTHYATISDRYHRAITGLSMGGHGAMYNAFKHPDVFGAVGSMSGAINVNNGGKNFTLASLLPSMTNGNTGNWGAHSVLAQIAHLKNQELAILFDCGINDFCLPYNEALHKALVDKKIDHDYTIRPGSHTWDYWTNSIDYHLLFFQKYFEIYF